MSVNGSPVANPFAGPSETRDGALTEEDEGEEEDGGKRGSAVQIGGADTLSSFKFPARTASTSTNASSSSQTLYARQGTHSHLRTRSQAMINVPTSTGQVLHLDPISTTPADIDAMEDLSDAAKKEAKKEMASLARQMTKLWTDDGD